MNRLNWFCSAILLAAVVLFLMPLTLSAQSDAPATASTERPPNIVFIMADDLGYGELGSYGQKIIRTPHLDRLAAEGMRFTRHYSGNAVCAPSRCVLMTGKHPGHAFIRNNREVRPEGQFPIPAEEITIAEWLKPAGYVTGAFGKWGLGPVGSSGDPLNQGFDRFFGYNCQREAHNYYPPYLYDDTRRQPLDNPDFSAHQKLPEGADPDDPASYEAFQGNDYAPDLINEQAVRFVREHRDRPFFLYYPTIVPHLAIQVPDDSLEEYRGEFEDPPYPGGNGYLPHPSPRAGYAAMVTRMDAAMGRLIDLIDELELSENTIIIFTSDNGPTYDRLGGSDSEFFNSTGGLRGMKGSLYEGGIRVPLIVRWKGRIQPGSVSDRVTGFEDWLPTLVELAGIDADLESGSIDGISFSKTLLGGQPARREFLYREFPGYGGQQAVWLGAEWKGIRQGLRPGRDGAPDLNIELYHLERNEDETNEVSDHFPEVVKRIREIMMREHRPSETFPFPALDQAGI